MMRKVALRGAAAGVAAYGAYSFFAPVQNDVDFTGKSKKKRITRFNSLAERGDDLSKMKTRTEQVAAMKSGEPFDLSLIHI